MFDQLVNFSQSVSVSSRIFMAWTKYGGLAAGLAGVVLLISTVSPIFRFQLESSSGTSNYALARASVEASLSEEQAKANEMQVANLKHALYGSPTPAKPHLIRKRAHAHLVRTLMAQRARESQLEREAQAAGARSLSDRQPYPTHKQILQAQPAAPAPQVLKDVTVVNPLGYLHADDHYANVGAVLNRTYFASKYSAAANGAPAGEAVNSTESKSAEARVQELADSSWDSDSSDAPKESISSGAMQNLNDADAPLPEGGVPVPGGHIIWVAENALQKDAKNEKQAAVTQPVRSKLAASAREATPDTAAAGQVPAGPSISIPLPLMEYSKVVAYGPDGKPELMWYRPGGPAPVQKPQFSGYADSRLSPGPRASQYSVLTTGQSNMQEPSSSRAGSLAQNFDDSRGRRAEAALSGEDRRIERDLLYRLLDRPKPAVPQQHFIKPSRVQELAESAGGQVRAGPLALTMLVCVLAAVFRP